MRQIQHRRKRLIQLMPVTEFAANPTQWTRAHGKRPRCRHGVSFRPDEVLTYLCVPTSPPDWVLAPANAAFDHSEATGEHLPRAREMPVVGATAP